MGWWYRVLYKEDWEETKKVFEGWWEGDLDRPLIQVVYPKDEGPPEIDSWAFMRYYPDFEEALRRLFQQFSRLTFWKEAYPNVWVNLGPGSLAAYLGAEVKFDPRVNTSWFSGSFSLKDLENVDFDPDNEWWRYTRRAYEAAREQCRGKAVIAFTDLLDAVTVTGQLRGNFPTSLLRDMFTERERVKRVLERVHDLLFRYYEESCRVINVEENGYSTWAGVWSAKKHFVLQCDFMVYLSPKMFREFILPLIAEECKYFDRTIWHLDGPLELPHLESLLSIKELDCIQWIPGEGNPDSGDECWVPLYRKIQKRGKMLQILVPPGKVTRVLAKIEKRGVAIGTVCSTREEAENLTKEIEDRFL
jgi:5-methyltetrahydrofolate--homocysteine methyltransferase